MSRSKAEPLALGGLSGVSPAIGPGGGVHRVVTARQVHGYGVVDRTRFDVGFTNCCRQVADTCGGQAVRGRENTVRGRQTEPTSPASVVAAGRKPLNCQNSQSVPVDGW